MNETDKAHPVALKPEDKALVEARVIVAVPGAEVTLAAKRNSREEWTFLADLATVHPAEMLDELRASLATAEAYIRRTCTPAALALDPYPDESLPDAANRVVAERDDLRAKLAEAEELIEQRDREVSAFIGANCDNADRAMKAEQERDAARRELREARSALLALDAIYRSELDEPANRPSWLQTAVDAAILARHEPERRKGERRQVPSHKICHCPTRRKDNSDRRKQPEAVKDETVCGIRCTILDDKAEAVDWQAKYESEKSVRDAFQRDLNHLQSRLNETENENGMLRQLLSETKFYLSNCNNTIARVRKVLGIEGIQGDEDTWFPNTEEAAQKVVARAEAAEAECERLKADNKNLAQTCIQRQGERHAALARAEQAEQKLAKTLEKLTASQNEFQPVWTINCRVHDLLTDDSRESSIDAATRVVRERDEAEAKLEKVRESLDDPKQGFHSIRDILGPTPPTQQQAKAEEWPFDQLSQEWGDAVQRRIQALEAAQKAGA